MKQYEAPTIEVVKFTIADIVTTSGGGTVMPWDPLVASANPEFE